MRFKPIRGKTLEQRLMEKVEMIPFHPCWEWIASKRPSGYGQMTTDDNRLTTEKRPITASRISFVLFVGPIPPGMLVCHSCDNPGCVRPQHLFLGTNWDNAQDRIKKGRKAGPKIKSQCKRGHQFTSDNTYIDTTGAQQCRTCNKARNLKSKRKKAIQRFPKGMT